MSAIATEKPAYVLTDELFDLSGLPISSEGSRWRLNGVANSNNIDWTPFHRVSLPLVSAAVEYMKSVVESQSPSSVYNTFKGISMVLENDAFNHASATGAELPLSMFDELLTRDRNDNYRVHYVRQWYDWCALRGFSQFSRDVAFEVAKLRIGGNNKGLAVLSADPSEGPLTDLEITCVLNALRASRHNSSLSIEEQAVLWLFVAFGSNTQQIALLRETDVKVLGNPTDGQFIQLEIPRIKKQEASIRSSFRSRRLTAEISQVIFDLMDFNRANRVSSPTNGSRFEIPLFQRLVPKSSMLGTPMEEYALHMDTNDVRKLVARATAALDVRSHRTGELIHLTPRRLRYTFASRLVREGVSKREVADLLDHTDLQNVQVYFDIKSDIVVKLDKAMATQLGPIAQAFMGKIVPRETDAERGTDPASRVAVLDKESAAVRPVGTCGSFSFCRLMAPVACYTCTSFQPWMDGPHDLLLDDLLKDRERKVASGKDGRMVAMLDDVILAVADVINRIDSVKAGSAI